MWARKFLRCVWADPVEIYGDRWDRVAHCEGWGARRMRERGRGEREKECMRIMWTCLGDLRVHACIGE